MMKLADLKKEHAHAVKEGLDSFVMDDPNTNETYTFLTKYAFYVIQYLEGTKQETFDCTR